MPTIFEQYAPYRPAQLSEDEQQMMDVMFRSVDPLEGEIRIGLERATASLGQKWNYPEDPGVTDKFPGVDPRGFYSEVDMALYDRYAKLAAAMPTRPPEVQAYVGGLLNQVAAKGTVLMQDWQRMRDTSLQLRNVTRAAKLAPTQRASDALLQNARERVAAEADFQRMDGFLTAMEYAAGLSDKAPDERAVSYLRDTVHAPIPDEVMAVRTAPAAAPDTLSVHFQNFDHVVEQQFFSNPRNWGKEPWQMPPDITNADAGALAVSKYAAATVDRTLQPLFEKLERVEPTSAIDSLDRGGLITVDGRTVRSMMMERYQGDPKQFSTWYRDNLREMTNQLVSAGLMAGKRVETFVPDAQGRLPKEPTQITKSGYEPSPLKKVTLNAWERHFAKHGFYKEKAARAAEYQRVMEGREQMRANFTAGQLFATRHTQPAVDDLFFHDYKQQHGVSSEERLIKAVRKDGEFKPGSAFRMDRSAPVNTCICYLSAQGHSIEDIMDPNKLQAERQAAGRLYLEKANAGDTRWLAETCFKGMHALIPQAREFLKQVDMSDLSQARENIARYAPIARPLFDVFQEASSAQTKAAFHQVAAEAGTVNGVKNGEDLLTLAQNAGLIMETVENALNAPLAVANPHATEAELKQGIANMIGMSVMQNAMHSNPNPDILQRYDMMDQASISMMGGLINTHPVVQGLYDQITASPATRQAMSQMGLSSQFQKQFSARFVTKGRFKEIELTPSKSLQASIEKQQKAQEFQKSHPKPEPKKDAPAKTSPQKAASQKAAPHKPAPAKNPGGMKK